MSITLFITSDCFGMSTDVNKCIFRGSNSAILNFAALVSRVQLLLKVHILPLTPGRVAQSVGHPTHKSGVLGSIPGLATYFRFSFRFFKKGSCQLLAKVCARSTG